MTPSAHQRHEHRIIDPQSEINTLALGSLIELKYRQWQCTVMHPAGSIERWMSGEVVHRADDSWPIVKLADGQITELRPFMSWRMRS